MTWRSLHKSNARRALDKWFVSGGFPRAGLGTFRRRRFEWGSAQLRQASECGFNCHPTRSHHFVTRMLFKPRLSYCECSMDGPWAVPTQHLAKAANSWWCRCLAGREYCVIVPHGSSDASQEAFVFRQSVGPVPCETSLRRHRDQMGAPGTRRSDEMASLIASSAGMVAQRVPNSLPAMASRRGRSDYARAGCFDFGFGGE